jgi:hypothetical protein
MGYPVKLSDVETLAELREWLAGNMPGAKLRDTADGLSIDTGLIVGMGGILESYPVVTSCKVCGYDSSLVDIVNDLCSVHTCKVCKREGYASGNNGRILCTAHGGQ